MNGTALDIGAIRYPGEKGAFVVLLLASFLPLLIVLAIGVNEPAAALGLLF